VLHANTVHGVLRLLSLWRGRLDQPISVDEASLNLVRTEQGRWNLDTFFRTATAHGGGDWQAAAKWRAGWRQAGGGKRLRVPVP